MTRFVQSAVEVYILIITNMHHVPPSTVSALSTVSQSIPCMAHTGLPGQVALSCYGSKICTSPRVMYGWVHDIDLILHGPAEDVGSLSISLAHIFSRTICQVSCSALDNSAVH